MGLREAFRDLVGLFFGQVHPPRPERALPDLDPRTHALRAFIRFIAGVQFAKTGDIGKPAIPFHVHEDDIYDTQPGDPAKLNFPSLSVVSSRGVHDQYALGAADLDEDTRDRFAPGTALVRLGEYVETLTIEAWGGNQAERRALLVGLSTAMRLSQRSQRLILELPDYYCQRSAFSLDESQYVDEPDVIRGRNRGQLIVTLHVPEVVLVDVMTMQPYLEVEVTSAETPEVC
jgi:hypothetical protein